MGQYVSQFVGSTWRQVNEMATTPPSQRYEQPPSTEPHGEAHDDERDDQANKEVAPVAAATVVRRKRPRLTEDVLLAPTGLQWLYEEAPKRLKFKGKSHEVFITAYAGNCE